MNVSSKKKTMKEELEGKSLWEIGEWLDTHDTGEYEDEWEEVQIQVVKPIKSRRFKDEKEMEEVLANEANEAKNVEAKEIQPKTVRSTKAKGRLVKTNSSRGNRIKRDSDKTKVGTSRQTVATTKTKKD